MKEVGVPNGFLDVPDVKLLSWSEAFGGNIDADPAKYGLSPAQTGAYSDLHAAFAATLQANLPQFRSKATTLLKNDARAALVADARLLVNLINGQKTLTDADKIGIGLPVRSKPTQNAPPDEAPFIEIVSVRGHTVSIRLGRSGVVGTKPAGVQGATLFRCISEDVPTPMSDWRFIGNFGRNAIDIDFPGALPPGAKVWLSAQWINTRLEGGPLCQAVSTHLQGGFPQMRPLKAA
jgi:hypothetical protein